MFKLAKRIIISSVAVALLVSAWTLWFAVTPMGMKTSPLEFSIRPGSSLRSATRQMIDAGLDMPAWQFNLLARLSLKDTSIKAGSYEAAPGSSPWELLGKITRGEFATAEITFIEGWTFRQVRSALRTHQAINHESEALSEAEIMARLGSPQQNPEGWFYPDTYLFSKGESDLAILGRAHVAMQKQLQSEWQKKAANLPIKTPYEALILASIVEKETGRAEDRAMIAAVFLNRLKAGMRLQTDPTIIYGLGAKFDGNLRKRHLQTDQAFNTYTRDGLPPWPIAMPGLASLRAVLNPADTKALYFVARGDGGSAFSHSLDEHNRAVQKYQLKR